MCEWHTRFFLIKQFIFFSFFENRLVRKFNYYLSYESFPIPEYSKIQWISLIQIFRSNFILLYLFIQELWVKKWNTKPRCKLNFGHEYFTAISLDKRGFYIAKLFVVLENSYFYIFGINKSDFATSYLNILAYFLPISGNPPPFPPKTLIIKCRISFI